ncbi:hypothetical protein [Arsenophonus endosymbiont of Crataerina pallida]|uniref:hypothetical protein n=1 Tax=Arsenophonus endosymbiont of Crataerina pallida TaxID=3066235 RepID=UPI0030D1FD33
MRYSLFASDKSGVGIETPVTKQAHSTPEACFFMRQSAPYQESMVGWMGEPKGSPGPV